MVEIVTVKIDGGRDRCTLPIDIVYSTIGRQVETSSINQYLRTICAYEMETLGTVRDNDTEKIWSNFIIRDHLLAKGGRKKETVINITIDCILATLNDLRSILEMDVEFLTRTDIYTNIRAHILTHNGMYLGHLYTWESDDTLYVDAIRSSITNILDRSRGEGIKGLVAMLTDSSIKVARLVGIDLVTVRDPYPVTKHVLDTMDFKENTFLVEKDIPKRVPKYRLIISSE